MSYPGHLTCAACRTTTRADLAEAAGWHLAALLCPPCQRTRAAGAAAGPAPAAPAPLLLVQTPAGLQVAFPELLEAAPVDDGQPGLQLSF